MLRLYGRDFGLRRVGTPTSALRPFGRSLPASAAREELLDRFLQERTPCAETCPDQPLVFDERRHSRDRGLKARAAPTGTLSPIEQLLRTLAGPVGDRIQRSFRECLQEIKSLVGKPLNRQAFGKVTACPTGSICSRHFSLLLAHDLSRQGDGERLGSGGGCPTSPDPKRTAWRIPRTAGLLILTLLRRLACAVTHGDAGQQPDLLAGEDKVRTWISPGTWPLSAVRPRTDGRAIAARARTSGPVVP
jgi:hypothetical protein